MVSKLITDRRGPLAYLVLNTPTRRNAISLHMWQAIPGIMAQLGQDNEIRCIVMTGAGTDAFSAGADISEFDTNRATAETARLYDDATRAAVASIMQTPKPVLAAIQGICYGGGMALAMACDLRLASADARFCIPAAKLGIAYGAAGTANLVAAVGAATAAEILLTARTYSAHEALMRGIVHQVSPAADFDTVISGYASAVAANAPLSMSATKSAIRLAVTGDPAASLAAEQAAQACAHSADYAEGRRAFAEKRRPRFNGS
jgi:enoyl-CoA hydratase/carnithine racemase